MKEFEALRGGDIKPEEVSKAQASFRTSLVQSYENLGSVLGAAITLLQNERPFDGPAADLDYPIALPQRGGELAHVARELVDDGPGVKFHQRVVFDFVDHLGNHGPNVGPVQRAMDFSGDAARGRLALDQGDLEPLVGQAQRGGHPGRLHHR